ncbi:MAG: barstar family protein [Planctomycetes bacterium]|nr:barstar family protein [Planctomycetota bacterium]
MTDACLVRIPSGILRKRELLRLYAEALDFPGYFGWNWDALADCLTDLGWFTEPRQVVIVHDSIPFQPKWTNRETYVSILRDVVASWGPGKPHECLCVFPEYCRDEIA